MAARIATLRARWSARASRSARSTRSGGTRVSADSPGRPRRSRGHARDNRSRCAPSSLVVTDLDGTLLDSSSRLSDANRRTLDTLGRNGVVRAVATGPLTLLRAPGDARGLSRRLSRVLQWRRNRFVGRRAAPALARDGSGPWSARLVARLRGLDLDFMVQHAAPDSHRFHFRAFVASQRGLRAPRRALPSIRGNRGATVPPGRAGSASSSSSSRRGPFRASSFSFGSSRRFTWCAPRRRWDHASTWIELFPAGVSKAHAGGLAARAACDRSPRAPSPWATTTTTSTCSNGRSMRASSRMRPPSMRERFAVVRANDDDGFTEAVSGTAGTAAEGRSGHRPDLRGEPDTRIEFGAVRFENGGQGRFDPATAPPG